MSQEQKAIRKAEIEHMATHRPRQDVRERFRRPAYQAAGKPGRKTVGEYMREKGLISGG